MKRYPMQLRRLPIDLEARTGYVREPFAVRWRKDRTVEVPAGFKTDFASTPRCLWFLFPQMGWWTAPAVMHDFLYAEKPNGITRADADWMFLCALIWTSSKTYGRYGLFTIEDVGRQYIKTAVNRLLNWPVPYMFYAGVRLGGWRHFK